MEPANAAELYLLAGLEAVISRGLRTTLSWLGLVVCFTAIGCGSDYEDSARLASDEQDHSLLSVIMAGSDSCNPVDGVRTPRGASIYPDFKNLIQSLRSSRAVRSDYIITCFSLRGRLLVSNSDDPLLVHSIDERDVPDYVQRFYDSHANQKLLWVGHSYGGWLTLKTLLALQEQNTTLPPPDLFTIDPISKRNCRVTSPLGCSSAPTDVSEADYLRLGEAVGEWMNFYQRKTPVVRSSAVKGARSNIELAVGHTRIDNHPVVWQNIAATLAGSNW